jgi:hypothetical protein
MHRSFKPVGVAMPIVLAATGALALFSAGAQAQTSADNAVQTSTISEIVGTHTDINIGVGAGIDQRYVGARDYCFEVLSTFDVSRGIFFAINSLHVYADSPHHLITSSPHHLITSCRSRRTIRRIASYVRQRVSASCNSDESRRRTKQLSPRTAVPYCDTPDH